MDIFEIFYSLQGEGILAGIPTIFIRTTGCNLRCSYCDTTYAYKGGNNMSIDTILLKVKSFNCTTICITGGEPLLQQETIPLITKLQEETYAVCLETNGSLPIQGITNRDDLMISMDMKMPSSTMQHHNLFKNIHHLSRHDQLKCIIETKDDYLYAKQILEQYHPCCPVIFQPVWGKDPKELASWILQDGLAVRLGLQLHKIIWGDTANR